MRHCTNSCSPHNFSQNQKKKKDVMICYNEPYLRYARFANGMNLMSLATYGYMRSLIDCKAVHDGICRHDRSHVMLYEHVLGFPNFTTTTVFTVLVFRHCRVARLHVTVPRSVYVVAHRPVPFMVIISDGLTLIYVRAANWHAATP